MVYIFSKYYYYLMKGLLLSCPCLSSAWAGLLGLLFMFVIILIAQPANGGCLINILTLVLTLLP